MYEFLGGISGGALGYIHNNVPGAIAGYKIGSRYGKSYQMSRKRSAPVGRPHPNKRRIVDIPKKVLRSGKARRRLFKKKFVPRPYPKLRNKREYAPIQHNDFTVARMKFNIGRGLLTKMSPATYRYTETWDVTDYGNEGCQSYFMVKNLMTKDQLAGITSNARNSTTSWEIQPWLLNPDSQQSLNGTIGGTQPNPWPTQVYGVQSVKMDIGFISLCSAPQEVEVMWMYCLKDTDSSPAYLWEDVLGRYSTNQGTFSAAALTTTSTASGGVFTPLRYGCPNPTVFKEFRKIWKCIHREKFILQPGDTRRYSNNCNVNRKVFATEMANRQTTYLAGYTIIPLIVVRGALAAIKDSGSTKPEVTFIKTAIGVYCENTYSFKTGINQSFGTARYFPGMVAGTTHATKPSAVPTSGETAFNDIDSFQDIYTVQ